MGKPSFDTGLWLEAILLSYKSDHFHFSLPSPPLPFCLMFPFPHLFPSCSPLPLFFFSQLSYLLSSIFAPFPFFLSLPPSHTQVQALVVATLATVLSIILGGDLTTFHQLLLGASSMGAASIASALLGTIMIGVIISSHYFRINPDNVATPIAASLGDLVTLGLLSLLAQGFYNSGSEWIGGCGTNRMVGVPVLWEWPLSSVVGVASVRIDGCGIMAKIQH